jgi:hypothetical protein
LHLFAHFSEKKRLFIFCRADGPSANQPKSTPASQKANQMQAEADQKRKSPLDSGCERMAFQTETFTMLATFHGVPSGSTSRDPLQPIPTYSNLFTPIYVPPPPPPLWFSPSHVASLTNLPGQKAGRFKPMQGKKMESCPHHSLNEKAGAQRSNKINYPPLIYG